MPVDQDIARKLELPPCRGGRAAKASHLARREADLSMFQQLPLHDDVHIENGLVGEVSYVRFAPAEPVGTLVFIHGGAFCAGEPGGRLSGFLSQIAGKAGCVVVSSSYRLAPEAAFPAALHDVAAVLESSAQQPGPIAIGGESAGGGLAAALAARWGTHCPVARLAAALLISPWLDLTGKSPTVVSRAATDRLFLPDRLIEAADDYLQGADPADPLASPLFADVSNMPPTQIFAGGEEILLDDSLSFARRLGHSGISVDLHVRAGLQHVFPTLFPELAESIQAMDLMADFLRANLSSTR